MSCSVDMLIVVIWSWWISGTGRSFLYFTVTSIWRIAVVGGDFRWVICLWSWCPWSGSIGGSFLISSFLAFYAECDDNYDKYNQKSCRHTITYNQTNTVLRWGSTICIKCCITYDELKWTSSWNLLMLSICCCTGKLYMANILGWNYRYRWWWKVTGLLDWFVICSWPA